MEITGYINPVKHDNAFKTTSHRDFTYENKTVLIFVQIEKYLLLLI